MKFLFKTEPYLEETLESYLLRLSQENDFESYSIFSNVLWDILMAYDYEAAGAFPRMLSRVNVYHASNSSGFRVRALQLIEQMTELPPMQLLSLALMHSATKFGQNTAAVFRNGVDIPRAFIRTQGIPVCPQCVHESPYIRQYWHYYPYQACHQHHCQLLYHCPSCDEELNYQLSESFTHCSCGYELSYETMPQATYEQQILSALVVGVGFESSNPLMATVDQSMRFGALHWYRQRYCLISEGAETPSIGFDDALDYFDSWPHSLWQDLDEIRVAAEYGQTKAFNRTSFKEVFGSLLLNCGQLPMRDTSHNFVLKEVQSYLSQLVREHPRTTQPNIADILLSVADAAAFLSISYEQVYRLYQEGMLPLAIRPSHHQHLDPYLPAFHLRHIAELKISRMQSYKDAMNIYLPAW